MASRTTLLTVSYIDNDESEPAFPEGSIDVGISGVEEFVTKYSKEYGRDMQTRDALFDEVVGELLFRFVKFHGTKDQQDLYEKIKQTIVEHLDSKEK